MPIMSGFEATKSIRALVEKQGRKRVKEQPLIIGVSGDTGLETEEKAKAAGIDILCISYISNNDKYFLVQKPIERNQMTKIVMELRESGICL